jgi:putative oxidoreductase
MFRWYGYIGGAGSLGLLILRLAYGAAFCFHGWGKIQDPTGWAGPNAPFPPYLLAAAAVAEFGGGIAMILGFLTPLFALGLACTMAVAALKIHIPHGDPFVGTAPGQMSYEPAVVYFAIAVCILLIGPGQLSLDYCLFGRRRSSAGLPPYVGR